MNAFQDKIAALRRELDGVVSGYPHIKTQMLVAMLARGHILLRAVPGTAKTTLAKTLNKCVSGAKFARFQMTPDMKPADILGVVIYNNKTNEFEIHPSDFVYANVALLDEINRTTPKTQSATLEAMQEGQVTIAKETFPLPDMFWVVATMNPIEQEGTFELPEAQLDRFAMLLDMGYVSRAEEFEMLRNLAVHGRNAQAKVTGVVTVADILTMRDEVDKIAANASDSVLKYIVDLVRATRPTDENFDAVHSVKAAGRNKGNAAGQKSFDAAMLRDIITLGGSPRAEIWTLHCAAAACFVAGDEFITPDHVKSVFRDVARHRINLSQVARQENTPDEVIDVVLSRVPVIEPRENR